MILSILLCALALQPSKQVSVSVEAGRADKAVAALSRASGIALRTDKAVAAEVVFVKVDHLPLKEVMSSLARVTGAEWRTEDDGSYLLTRTKARIAKETKREENRKLASLEAWRKDLLKCLNVAYESKNLKRLVKEKSRLGALNQAGRIISPPQHPVWKRIQDLERADPTYRALARSVKDLDLRPAAALPPQACVVFATKPNRAQLALGPGATVAMRKLQPEQTAWGNALKTKPLAKGEDPKVRFSTDNTIQFFKEARDKDYFGARTDPWSRTLPYENKPASIVLTIACYSEDAYEMELAILDAKGDAVLEFECGDISTYPSTQVDKVSTDGKSTPKLKPSAEFLALHTRMETSGEKAKPAIKTLMRFFVDPVENEPLWIGNQQMLTALAKGKRKSVIACLTDEAMAMFEDSLNLSGYAESREMIATESAKCIELRPERFIKHWNQRADRTLMASCARAYLKNGKIDLLTAAKFVANAGDNVDRARLGCFIQLIDPDYRSSYASFEFPFQNAFVSLLASLSDEQLARIKNGETIAYRDLTAAQLSLVSRIVYGVRANVTTDGQVPGGLADVSPTFELPDGVLTGAGLSGSVGEDQFAVFHNGRGASDDFFRVNLNHPDPPGFWSGPPPFLPAGGMSATMVTLHMQSYITLKCALAPGHFVVGHCAEPLGKAAGPPVLIGKLPKEIQDRLAPTVKFLGSFGQGRKS